MFNILERSFLKSTTFSRDKCAQLVRGLTTVSGLGFIDIEIDGNCNCSQFIYTGTGTMEFRYKAYEDSGWIISNQKIINFFPSKNIYDARITISGSSVCSGVYLYSWSNPIVVSVSGIIMPSSDLPPIEVQIYNDSPQKTNAIAKILPSYTGDYVVDRSIKLTTNYNYDVAGSGTVWYDIDHGIAVPEQISWYKGKFNSTIYTMGELRLFGGTSSGSWVSPVFYIPDSECRSAVVYSTGSIVSTNISSAYKLLEVRATDSPPPKARFIITSTDNRTNNLMGYHKRIYMDDLGNIINMQICSGNTADNYKLWRDPAGNFGNKMLKQYPNMNEYDDAVFYASGYTNCTSNSIPTAELNRFIFCKTDLDVKDYSGWSVGKSATGQIGGASKTVIFTKPLKVYDFPGLWQAISIVGDFVGNVTYVQRAMFNQTQYLWSQHMQYSWAFFNTDIGYAACEAHDIDGFWVQIQNTIDKYNLVDSSPVASFDSNGNYFKFMAAVPNSKIRGFWGIGDNFISFYNHTEQIGGNLEQVFTVQNSYYNSNYLSDLYSGAVDQNNNLWAVSVSGNRVVRVNYSAQQIDFDMTVSGVVGVVPHSSNDSAYLLVVNSSSEKIYMANITYPSGLLYCATVSGFNSNSFKYGITFCGRSLESQGTPVSIFDPVWGSTTSGWWEYPSNYMGLPKGKYKQFRVTLQKSDMISTSPAVQKFRIPHPLLIDRLPWHEKQSIFIGSHILPTATNGTYNFDLITWWTQE